MNIFYLDKIPAVAAAYHCDKHCIKMILESCQLLSTALRVNGIEDEILYKMTHKNHPSAIWARTNQSNYMWLLSLTISLLSEYSKRYGKTHKCSQMIKSFINHIDALPEGNFTEPPQCMPDDCKGDNTVEAYRNYYRVHKAYMATWKTKTPNWFYFDLGDDVIDTRDIIERIEELESDAETGSDLTEEETAELNKLRDLIEECSQYNSDTEYGATLINENYWVDYVKELLEDCGDIPRDLPHYIAIDWEETASNIQVDYVTITVDHHTYFLLST